MRSNALEVAELTLHTDTPDAFAGALAALEGAWGIGAAAIAPAPLVIDRIG